MTDDRGQMTKDSNRPSSVVRHPSSESDQRAAIVAAARSWIKTPYHNNADIKGVGVDCGMLIVRVFVDTGLCPPFDPRPYPPDWHLHRNEERYLGFVFDRCAEVSAPQPGDVMVLRFGRCYSHGGIVTVTAPLTIVHAYYKAHRVLEEDIGRNSILSDPLRKPRFFSFWAKMS
jgi:cell wall-associated NlpC family hydrolase